MSNISLDRMISHQSINENQSTNQSTLDKIIEHPKAKIAAGCLGLSLVAAGVTGLALTASMGAVAAVASGVILAAVLVASVASIYFGFVNDKKEVKQPEVQQRTDEMRKHLHTIEEASQYEEDPNFERDELQTRIEKQEGLDINLNDIIHYENKAWALEMLAEKYDTETVNKMFIDNHPGTELVHKEFSHKTEDKDKEKKIDNDPSMNDLRQILMHCKHSYKFTPYNKSNCHAISARELMSYAISDDSMLFNKTKLLTTGKANHEDTTNDRLDPLTRERATIIKHTNQILIPEKEVGISIELDQLKQEYKKEDTNLNKNLSNPEEFNKSYNKMIGYNARIEEIEQNRKVRNILQDEDVSNNTIISCSTETHEFLLRRDENGINYIFNNDKDTNRYKWKKIDQDSSALNVTYDEYRIFKIADNNGVNNL